MWPTGVTWKVLVALVATGAAGFGSRHPQPSPRSATPEALAVAFLVREVPKWHQEHACHSCHNNGDAARALLAAARAGHDVNAALSETVAWLREPSRWEENSSTGGVDNKPLARLQFAGALASAVEHGLASRAALAVAAGLVVKDQQADGSWRLDSAQSLGTPVTYGTALATRSARRILIGATEAHLQPAIARADAWLRAMEAASVLDAAAVTLGLELARDAAALTQRTWCLEILKRGQGPDGGWGPYVTSASEPFDTSITVLALTMVANEPALAQPVFTETEINRAIGRGRAFLLARQQRDDGSWLETTRPANQESYAQRISTTGWATLALLASANR